VRARTGLPVMKAIGIAEAEDLSRIDIYSEVADQLLIDAKPPKDRHASGGQRAQLRLAASGGAEILDETLDAGRWTDARQRGRGGAPLNSFMTGPDEKGRFGDFGGRFVSETLMPLILELEAQYENAKTDQSFWAEMDDLWTNYVGRPSARSISPNA
jgi:hypothetical protein